LVEVVSYADGRVLPERCLACGDIPDELLPSPDLRVTSVAAREQPAGGPLAALGGATSDEYARVGQVLHAA
jgi:hypothetical protein